MQKPAQDSQQEQLLKDIATFLQEAHIPYMVTGSVSSIFYGRPRASHDIDFIIEAENNESQRIREVFASLPRREFVVDPLYIEEAVSQKTQFNIFHLPTGLKLDFWLLKETSFDKQRFKRRKDVHVFGQTITFASPEDTILKKLLWYQESNSEKHLIDAAFVYQIQKGNLDEVYLQTWAKRHKTTKLLQEISEIDLEQHY